MSLSIDNYAGSLADIYQTNNTGAGSKVEQTLNQSDFDNATDEELMEVCKQFEAYFLEQLFEGMERMIPTSDDENSSASKTVDFFKETAIQELAETTTDTQSLGLAQMLYESMKRDYGI